MLKTLLCGTLLAGSIAAAPLTVPAGSKPRPVAIAAPRATEDGPAQPAGAGDPTSPRGLAPKLLTTPACVLLHPTQTSSFVTLTGDRFGQDATITLNGRRHIFTYGPQAIDVIGATALRFDAEAIEDGTYSVSVRAASGLRSNEMTMIVRRTEQPVGRAEARGGCW